MPVTDAMAVDFIGLNVVVMGFNQGQGDLSCRKDSFAPIRCSFLSLVKCSFYRLGYETIP